MESGKYFSTPTLNLSNQGLANVYEQICNNNDDNADTGNANTNSNPNANSMDKTPPAGTISKQIGSTVDILLNY